MSKHFFAESSHVAYQIKGNGTQSTMQAQSLSLHTPSTPDGVKRSKYLIAKICHVAYQHKGNGTQSNMQAHILSLYTTSGAQWLSGRMLD